MALGILLFSADLLAVSSRNPNGWQKDTVKINKDSLMQLIRQKDSLLFQASLDSLFMISMVRSLEKDSDSMTLVHRSLLLKTKTDSALAYQRRQESVSLNRTARWNLRDSVFLIDEDSVRRSVGRLLDVMFDDSATSVRPFELRYSMHRLMHHLANDSVNLRFLNAKSDTINLTLSKFYPDSAAFFVMNEAMDSAKIFIRSLDKNTLYLWVNDDLMLKKMLKKPALASMIKTHQVELSKHKMARRPLPPMPHKPWDLGAEFNFGLSQVAFSHWAKGGISTITFTPDVRTWANYSRGNMSWTNVFQLVEGLQKQELQSMRKSQDRIELRSSFNHKAFSNYEYSLDGGILTQLFKGYAYPNDSVPVSKIMAPGTITLNLGMNYRPQKDLLIKLSPAGFKTTIVLDTVLIDQRRFGLKEGQRFRPEFGAQFFGQYKVLLFQNVTMTTQLTLFSDYLGKPENIDVDWRLKLDLKVNKYLSASVNTHLIYDEDIMIPLFEIRDGKKVKVGEGSRVQFMESMSIGFKFYL